MRGRRPSASPSGCSCRTSDLAADWGGIRGQYLSEGATPQILIALNLRLANWLTNHVFNTDKELGRFLAQAAAKARGADRGAG
jgi:hypothetical protein